jgi:hypothetical protein
LSQDLVELVGDVSEIELGESVDVARGKLEALQVKNPKSPNSNPPSTRHQTPDDKRRRISPDGNPKP